MNRFETVVLVTVVVITAAVGWVVAGAMPGYDPDEVCASAHDDGWTYFEAEDTDGFYCQAPNGSVHLTIVDMGGPGFDWGDVALVGLMVLIVAPAVLFIPRLKIANEDDE